MYETLAPVVLFTKLYHVGPKEGSVVVKITAIVYLGPMFVINRSVVLTLGSVDEIIHHCSQITFS